MSTAIGAISVPVDLPVIDARLPTLFLSDARRSERFWEFFAANILNKNTRGPITRPRAGSTTGVKD